MELREYPHTQGTKGDKGTKETKRFKGSRDIQRHKNIEKLRI